MIDNQLYFTEIIVSNVKVNLLQDAHSCAGRCHQRPVEMTEACRCDPYCNEFNDCCFDYNTTCPNNNSDILMSTRRIPIFPFAPMNNRDEEVNFLVIASCPDNWTGLEIRNKCQSLSEGLTMS